MAYSAYPPPDSKAITRSVCSPFSLITYPAHSNPRIYDAPAGGGYLPDRYNKSALFNDVALIFIKTSFSFGTGMGDCPSIIT